MSAFEDHFSQQANDYALYRPHYPEELFSYLASLVPEHNLAWDCGTGNGQAAIGLAKHFERVVATDLSAEQIARAAAHERIVYRVEPAEEPHLEDGSVDLVTVAIAAHWFDLPRFYSTVRRVTVPKGILAVWSYHLARVDPAVDAILVDYYQKILAGYWPEKFHHVDEGYQNLPFPFPELHPPVFEMHAEWNLDQLAGFLNSWSATQRYLANRGIHPVSLIWRDLRKTWGAPEQRRPVRWPIAMRVGRVLA